MADLDTLLRLHREEDDLAERLSAVELRIVQARAYLRDPDAHQRLGLSYLERYQVQRSRLRIWIDDVHAQALRLLDDDDGGTPHAA